MCPPRILTVNGRVSAHLGVNMWSWRPWSSGMQWWHRRRRRWGFSCHSGVSGRHGVRTWLYGGYCILSWFAKWHWVLVDGPKRWILSVAAFSWADSVSMRGLFWALGCCRGEWAVLWVFRQFCGRFYGRLVVIRGLRLRWGLTWGAVVAVAVARSADSCHA